MPIIQMPETEAEWKRRRVLYIGASELASLVGEGAGFALSPLALYLIKRGDIPAPEFDNTRMEAGRRMEPVIAKWACDQEGWTELPAVYAIDDVCEGMAASLDRVILPNEDEKNAGYTGPGPLECKNVDGLQFRDKWLGGEPPLYYRLQLQQQLACSGYRWGAIVALVGGNDLKIWRYQRHEALIDQVRRVVADFWASVRDGTPPPPDGLESTTRAIKALFSAVREDVTVDLTGDNELPGLCIEEDRLADEAGRIKKRREEIQNIIRFRMGAARYARIAGGIKISHSIGKGTPDRTAKPDELIRGRKGQDRLTITVPQEAA